LGQPERARSVRAGSRSARHCCKYTDAHQQSNGDGLGLFARAGFSNTCWASARETRSCPRSKHVQTPLKGFRPARNSNSATTVTFNPLADVCLPRWKIDSDGSATSGDHIFVAHKSDDLVRQCNDEVATIGTRRDAIITSEARIECERFAVRSNVAPDALRTTHACYCLGQCRNTMLWKAGPIQDSVGWCFRLHPAADG
jgi:hypothetical protein